MEIDGGAVAPVELRGAAGALRSAQAAATSPPPDASAPASGAGASAAPQRPRRVMLRKYYPMVHDLMDYALPGGRAFILTPAHWLEYEGVFLRPSNHSLHVFRRLELAAVNAPTRCERCACGVRRSGSLRARGPLFLTAGVDPWNEA